MRIESRTTLRPPVEKGIATSDVGGERVKLPDTIPKLHLVLVTGSSAIGEISPLGQKGAEDTMLHMKHGHVLMQGDFEPVRRRHRQQLEDLADIEIIRDRQVFQSLLDEAGGRNRIGDIEGEISDLSSLCRLPKVMNPSEVSHEHSIRLRFLDDTKQACLARFLNSGSREEQRSLGVFGSHPVYEIAIPSHILEIDVEVGHSRLDRRVDLLLRSTKNAQLGLLDGRGRNGRKDVLHGHPGNAALRKRVPPTLIQSLNQGTAHPIELAHRTHHFAVQFDLQPNQLVDRAAETTELLLQNGFLERSFLRYLEGLG